ncbi:DinB family protein [Actinocorallia aurea]
MNENAPSDDGEKESLRAALDRQRDVVLWKLDGLTDARLRRPMTPSGTSLLGLVKHLASVEYAWFREAFALPAEPLWFDPFTEDMAAAESESAAELVAFYARARTAADQTIAALPLEAEGTSWRGRPVTLRWVLIHMIEETARHAGHMDILRELLDGAAGDHPPAGFSAPGLPVGS